MEDIKEDNNLSNKKEKKNSRVRKIIKGVVEWTVYFLVFLLIVWGTPEALSRLLHTEYPIASITSSSMWPVLKQGDIVLIQGVSSRVDIALNDIVVYSNERGFTIHRVIKLGADTFITRGDANNVDDKPVSYDQLVGKTVMLKGKPFRVPYLGKLGMMIKK